jgi:hypothetical protein
LGRSSLGQVRARTRVVHHHPSAFPALC